VAIVDRGASRPQFSPTIEAAFRARRPWLRLFCAGCQQQYEIDLRRIVRPADFPIMALRAALVCESMYLGDGPVPQLLGLERVPFDHRKRTAERTLRLCKPTKFICCARSVFGRARGRR
jgi:hypothetical protein